MMPFMDIVRMHHVLDGEDNGFDRVTGSAVGFGLEYGIKILERLKVEMEISTEHKTIQGS